MANRYALIDANNLVVNIVLWDGVAQTWTPPFNLTAVRTDTGNIGDTFTGPSTFTPPDQIALAAGILAALRSSAIVNVTDGAPSFKALRGALLALLDQINVIRAALPTPLGAITPNQAINAIVAKINSGAAD